MTTRYTEFPNLKAVEEELLEDVDHQISTHVSAEVNLDLLLISWAILLRSYTEEKAPVFRIHEDSVVVNTSDLASTVISKVSPVEGYKYTGIVGLDEQAPDGFDLLLRIDKTGRCSSLTSSSRVPLKQLQYIGDQFDYITRHAATVTEKAMSWRDFSGSRLSIMNEAPCRVKGPELLHQLLEKHAYNSACALEFRRPDLGLQRFSYDDLHRKSAQFAKRIRALFQEPGFVNHSKPKIVPLLVPQCAELYIAILAILKAGAAFCPLHLDAPTERIKFITEDVAAQITVTTSSLRDQIAWENPSRVLLVDDILEDYDGPSSGDEAFSQETCEPEDLAYVMYTSGSTGLPKAVAISHLAASQSLLAHDKHIPTFHRFLQFAAPTFDVFVFEMFFPLYRGKTLVGCDRAELLSDLPAIINSLDIDAAELTPTVVGNLIQRRSNVPCLKVLLTIGEMLTRPIITEFGGSSLKEGILHGMYGPTEAAIHCTLATQFSSRSKPGIIGVPLDTVSCLVVAPQTLGNDVSQDIDILPAGQIGELAIGGMQLADGYINRLEQTSSVFVDTKLLGRIYRTGDKARLLPDGVLECLGRINAGQVKLRGQRIELGEIEQIAYGINGIISANAMIIGGIIVLFCVTKDEEITSDTVLRSCRRWLPGFVVPGDVSILHDVPRLPSGKVDKSKLQADYEESRIDPVFTQGCTLSDTEQQISRFTQELLNLNIHVSANLTAAGLDSLKAIRLASMLRSVGIIVGAVDILKANSIQAIAEVWHTTKSTDTLQITETLSSDWKLIHDDVFCELKRLLSTSESGHIQDIIPCTPLQIAMLSETAIHNESYCNWIELECSSSLNFETIQAAFFKIIDHNEILRTGFIQSSNAAHPFVQVIWKCLPESQISQVSSIKHDFQLNSTSDTLRPLRVQTSYLERKATIVVQIHHAIYDGWSWEHIVGDLDLLLRNRDIISRPQFRELVALYQQPAAPARSAISLTYWQNLLQGAPSCRLPNLHGRTDTKSGLQIARATIVTQLYQVESVARQLGVSLQSIFQAAFAWLISMYLGSSDIIFGTVSSGRTLPVTGIEDLLGPCITTLPTRVDVEHSRTTHDLIQAIHRLNRQMLEHHEIPLREINRLCGIESGKALFDSILIWQQTLQDRRPKALSQVNAKDHLEFNLSLEIEPCENVFNVKANYQRSILPEPQAHLLIRQLDQLITAFVRDEPTLLVEINSYLDEEILSLQNPEFENYSIPESLSTPVEIFANEKPTAIALEFVRGINGSLVEKEQISYRRLNERANQLAHFLVEQKVCPDELVCICMEKSVELYVGILGIIKTGAGYLPVSPDMPTKRRNEILSRSKAKICICSSSLLEQNTELRMNTGNLDYEGMNFTPKYSDSSLRQPNIESFPALVTPIYIDKIDLGHMPTSNFALAAQPSHLAYAVFTSGTTGSPKGVLVTRRNILSNLVALSKIYPASEGSKLLQSCSQAFDVSVFEIFFAWFTGMCLCSASQNVLFRDFQGAIRAMEITHLSLTPTVAALVEPNNVPLVRFLVTAGEAVSAKVFQSWAGKGLFQGYGPSETTNICTVKSCVVASDTINNIGPPLRNTSAFVIQGSAKLLMVPKGGIGELCFGGDQVFRGYLDMPALNSEKLIDHPKFGRLYRSGDYGRILWDGSLEYIRRQDDQVKIRGQRVELGEINSAILRSPDTLDVVTLIQQTKSRSQRILTFWVPKSQSSSEWCDINYNDVSKQALNGLYLDLLTTLPSYMIPSLIIPIPCVPMTAQEKVDKRRLIELASDLSQEDLERFSQPIEHGDEGQQWSELENMILRTLCASMNCSLDDVGRRTSFHSLGLDSISAVSFAKCLRDLGFPKADASIVLKHPSILLLSNFLAQNKDDQEPENNVSINVHMVFDQTEKSRICQSYENSGLHILKILPCTPLQEAMLASFTSDTHNTYYNHTIFEIHGDLDRLFKVWTNIVAKFDILRTAFTATKDKDHSFAQIVFSSHDIDWTTIETLDENLPAALNDRMTQVTRIASGYNPPYSLTAFKTERKTNLLLSMHHALYDGEAIQLLLDEIKNAYDGTSMPPAVPFESFLEYQLSLDLDKADDFWKTLLKSFHPMAFPGRFLNPASVQGEIKPSGTFITQFSSAASLESLENDCKKLSITLLSLFQASWARLLSLYIGHTDVCFGNVVNGRTVPLDGVEKIIAPCFNTLPVRMQLTSSMSNLELINNANAYNLQILPYQFTPLRRISRNCSHDSSRLFDTLFILQKPQVSLDNHIWSVKRDIGIMDLPIVCELIPFRNQNVLQYNLHSHFDYDSSDFCLDVLKILDSIMHECLRYPSSLVMDFEFLDKDLLTKTKSAANAFSIARTEGFARSLESHRSEPNVESQTRWSSNQIEVLDIVSKLSKQQPKSIGLQTTFFRLGLDSINAVQIAAQLKQRGLKVSPIEVLEYPTIEKLSAHLQSEAKFCDKNLVSLDFRAYDRKFRPELCHRLAICDADLEKIRPCTKTQSGMLAAFQKSNGSLYFNSIEIELLDDSQSLRRLQKAWNHVTAKYEMLRTGFALVDDSNHPFAMLTYTKGSSYFDHDLLQELALHSLDSLSERTSTVSNIVLHSLHLPPWRVEAVRRGNTFAIMMHIHHAMFDAYSLRLILDDFVKSSQGIKLSAEIPIDLLLQPILIESDSNLDDKKNFWHEYTKDISVTKFPSTTVLQVQSSKTYSLQKRCTMALQKIHSRCQDLGVTIYAVCQVSWARILCIYTGETSVIFGSVFSGRTNLEHADTVAFPSIATLPICIRVGSSSRDLLGQTMRSQPSLLKHQFTPLSNIQRWADHVDESLFDSILVYQDILGQQEDSKKMWKILDETASVDYPISIEFTQCEDDDKYLEIRLVAAENILPREQASILLDQLDITLNDTINHPDRQINDTSSFPTGLLSVSPAKEACIPSNVYLLHQFLEFQASVCPQKTALEFVTSCEMDRIVKHEWTYHELNMEGVKVAQELISMGVKPQSMIAICFNKCPEASFAILGILKAGCSFVAIDPAAPADRQEFIVRDSKSCLVLAAKDTVEALRENIKVPVASLENRGKSFTASPTSLHQLSPRPQGSDTCYCLYTSGTSGTPKACLLTHENAVQAILSFQRLFAGSWGADSRFLQFASFHFDVSILEQFWSWSVGVCVTSAPRDLIFEDISGAIRALGITHLDLTPSLAKTLHPDDVPLVCKGVFITGGEKLEQDIIDVWGPKQCIYNGYGPTETTIGNTMFPRVPKDGKPSNIGRQFDNVGTYVFHVGTESPVLRGGIGELCISGKLVGPGYLNQPELTKQKFPFLNNFGERAYRTGDLVRILHDGSFDFIGRADEQIKLRGQRLEVGEINEVIKRGVDKVRDVATLVIEHIKSQRLQLVSFFVPSPPKNRGMVLRILNGDVPRKIASTIRQICQAKLPPYMIPTHFIPVSSIPLSSNNKIESKKLKLLYNNLSFVDLENMSMVQREPRPTWSDVEKRIVDLLIKTTGSEAASISRDSSIFRQGLDSISVVHFARCLKAAGFPNAQVSTVMQNPNLGQLCAVLTGSTDKINDYSSAHFLARQNIEAFGHRHLLTVCKTLAISIDDGLDRIAPCTPLQEGIISRSLRSETPIYFEKFHFKLSETVEIDRLKHAWAQVITSTEMLRTRFSPTVDGYAQAVCKKVQLPWYEEGFSSEGELEDFKNRRYHSWWTGNRELSGSMFEIIVLQCGKRKLMCLYIFHALYDGQSLPRILNNVMLEYAGVLEVNYGPSFHEILPFGPLCLANGAKEFWRSHLGGLSYQPLPTSSIPSSQAANSAFLELPPLSINDAKRRYNTTHQSIVQAAWYIVLRRHFPSQVALGIVISGRSIDFEDADKVIGPLFNTIPFHFDVGSCRSWAEAVEHCHEFNSAVLPFQHSSLHDVMKWCHRSSEQPLFETLFVFQRELTKASEITDPIWKQLETAPIADYPLSFEAQLLPDDATLRLTAVAQNGVSSKENLMQMLDDFRITLSEITANSPGPFMGASKAAQNVRTPNEAPISNNRDEILPIPERVLFQWSINACAIRDEIAILADCDPSSLGARSSVFTLGIDSIDIIKLSSRLKRRSINLSVSKIMHNATIEQMVQAIANDPKPVPDDLEKNYMSDFVEQLLVYMRKSGYTMDNVEAVLPPTPLQEAIVADMSSTESMRYFNHEVLLLEPLTDVNKLILAFNTVIDESPILRTSFTSIDDPGISASFAQVIHKPGLSHIRCFEIGPSDTFDNVIQKAMNQDKLMARDKVACMITFIVGERESHMVLSLSHALYDGWSISLLHEDVLSAYHDHFTARPFYDKVLGHILNSSGNEALQYWSNYTSGIKICSFPTRSKKASLQPQVHRLEKRSYISATSISAFTKNQGVSLQALGQTCWALVLASYLGTLDVVFGVVLSGRDSEESQQVMFPMMNTILVRSILHGSVKQMLHDMQDGCAYATQFQHFPLRRAQAAAKQSYSRLFDSLFIFQREPPSSSTYRQLYKPVENRSSVEFPVCVEMEIHGDNLDWRTACENLVFDEEGSADLLQRLESTLQYILKSPESLTVQLTGHDMVICDLPPVHIDISRHETTDSLVETPEISSSEEAWTNTESTIRKILSDVSRVPEKDIGRQQTVFNLGLDSISVIKVTSLLRKCSLNITTSEILKAATIFNMGQIADAKVSIIPVEKVYNHQFLRQKLALLPIEEILLNAEINLENVHEILPSTPGQVYMLSCWQNSEGSVFYPTFSYHASERLEKHRLNEAWETLCKKSPILRTTFASTGDRRVPFVQVILKGNLNPITWLAKPELQEAFDTPLHKPLVSLGVYLPQDSTTTTIIFLKIHHALYDGVSLNILMQQLQELYQNPQASLEVETSFEDFLAYNLNPAGETAAREFWTSYLSENNSALIPVSESKPTHMRTSKFAPTLTSTGPLSTLARSSNLTLQAIFLASYAHIHAKLFSFLNPTSPSSPPPYIILGIYLANRSLPLENLPRLAAPTLNLVPIRVRAPLSTPILEIAATIQQDLQEISSAQNSMVGLWEIQDWTGVVVDCFVNFLSLPDSDKSKDDDEIPQWKEVSLETTPDGTQKTPSSSSSSSPFKDFDSNPVAETYRSSIDIEAAIRNGALDVGIFYPHALKGSEMVGWMMEELKLLLEGL